MAVVKIGAIRTTLRSAVRYIAQAHKTGGGIFMSTNCVIVPWDPDAITDVFDDVLRIAELKRGKGAPAKVLAYHVIQSFAPGETTPDKAHEIGFKFAEAITNNDYDFVIATHVDRDHVHNHIIFCAANSYTFKRYQMPKQRVWEYREISDKLCREYGLSVIEQPGPAREDIGAIYARADGRSTKAILTDKIDEAVRTSFTWDAFVDTLSEMHVEVKVRKSHVLYSLPGMERPVRGVKLGPAYTESALAVRLGRQTMCEYILQRRLVTILDKDRAQIRIPGVKPACFITVPRHRLVDHDATYRLFLPETTILRLKDAQGHLAGTRTAPELYEWLTRPGWIVDKPSTQTITRGKTARQKAFFEAIDRKVNLLHDQAAVTNLIAEYTASGSVERTAFMRELREDILATEGILQDSILERQTLLDTGEDSQTIDHQIEELSERVRLLHRVHSHITNQQERGTTR